MSNVVLSDNTIRSEEIVLSLTDVAHLFRTPSIDPLSKSPAEVLGVSGVDYLLGLLHMNKRQQQAHTLLILLPAAKAPNTVAEDTRRSLRRVVESRVEQERRELNNTYRYGWKVTGVVILATCLALSSLFTSELTEGMPPIFRQTFEYGFEIIGWVMLWHPIETLAFTPLTFRARISALDALGSMDVAVRAQTVAASS